MRDEKSIQNFQLLYTAVCIFSSAHSLIQPVSMLSACPFSSGEEPELRIYLILTALAFTLHVELQRSY